MKEYLNERQIGEYTEGQFAGVINNLLKNKIICKLDRGVYMLAEKNEDSRRKCFVVSPIGDDGSDIRKNADQLFNHIIKPVCEQCGFVQYVLIIKTRRIRLPGHFGQSGPL